MNIQLVLEISAVVTVISAGISYITFRKTSSLTYVTQERKEWREAIRRITEELEHCPYKKRKKVLVQLKTRINAYGLNSIEVLEDAHIWRQIRKLEVCEEKEYDDLKNQLILYLSLLLKYDWERSKKEVHGEPWKIVGNMFAIAALIFLEIGLYQLSNNAVPGLEMALLLLGLVFALFKKKKETRKNEPYKVLLYSALPLGCVLFLVVAYRFAKINVLKQQYIVLAVIAAYVATAIQLMVDLSEMFEMGTYECCINKVSGTKVRGKNIWVKWKERLKQKMRIKKGPLNAWNSMIIGVVLTVPQVVLYLAMKYGVSEHIDRMDKLSLHIATASLSVTIIIALLVYWLQKPDDNKEQYLEEKNPKRVQDIKEMMELENRDEDDGM